MAIDYKKEWYRFMDLHGHQLIYDDNTQERLKDKMCRQINNTIQRREKLMEEYIKERIRTNITGGDKGSHFIDIFDLERKIADAYVCKVDFDAWCEKKGGKG